MQLVYCKAGPAEVSERIGFEMTVEDKPTCGVVMPISAIEGLDEGHWVEVYSIISDAALKAGFEANIVSNADDIGVIQKRIVENLYLNPIVVCDVSAKNPNVMFELGMRLAFDKPTIIIKDEKTSYSFDTSPIEHLTYPRDLRFSKIVEFKEKLTSKITSTVKSAKDNNYSPFLKHFGEFKVAKLDTKEVGGQELIIDEVRSLRRIVERLSRTQDNARSSPTDAVAQNSVTLEFRDLKKADIDAMRNFLMSQEGVYYVRAYSSPNNISFFEVDIPGQPLMMRDRIRSIAAEYYGHLRSSLAMRAKTQPADAGA